MKPSTQDRTEGKLHEVKGQIKEEVGKVTNDPDLEVQGKQRRKPAKHKNGSAVPKKPSGSNGRVSGWQDNRREWRNTVQIGSDSCVKIKDLGFTPSMHIKMYGERFEIVSDPFDEGDCVAVRAISGNNPEIRTLRLPIAILVGLADRFSEGSKLTVQSNHVWM